MPLFTVCNSLTLPYTKHTLTLDGFLFVDELLAHPQFRSYSLEDVERVVNTNDKQRFKLRSHPENGGLQVRASQGHSIKVHLCQGFPPMTRFCSRSGGT